MHTIYIRTLKKADHTVFCVADGQKTYFDPQYVRCGARRLAHPPRGTSTRD